MLNKFFGFDQDWGISATDIFLDACEKKKAEEEKLLEEQHRTEAINMIVGMIYDFFRYLGFQGKNEDVMKYLDQYAAAERIYNSLDNARVSDELKLAAVTYIRDDTAASYEYADDAPVEKEHFRIIASVMNKILNNMKNK